MSRDIMLLLFGESFIFPSYAEKSLAIFPNPSYLDLNNISESKFAIICSKSNFNEAADMGHILSEKGIFVIHISTRLIPDMNTPVCVVPEEMICKATSSLLDIIFCENNQINIDLYDIISTLHNTSEFLISRHALSETDPDDEGRIIPILQRAEYIHGCTHLLMDITLSSHLSSPLRIDEISPLNTFIQKLSPDCNLIWGLSRSNKLPSSGNESIAITFLSAR